MAMKIIFISTAFPTLCKEGDDTHFEKGRGRKWGNDHQGGIAGQVAISC